MGNAPPPNAVEADQVASLARRIIADMAPSELPDFEDMAVPYLRNPRRAERQLKRERKRALRFGVEDLTPVAALVASAAVTMATQRFIVAADSKIKRILLRIMRRPALVIESDGERLERIRQLTKAKAEDLGLPQAQAETMAACVVAFIVLPPPK